MYENVIGYVGPASRPCEQPSTRDEPITPLNGTEETIFHDKYRSLIDEWERIKLE